MERHEGTSWKIGLMVASEIDSRALGTIPDSGPKSRGLLIFFFGFNLFGRDVEWDANHIPLCALALGADPDEGDTGNPLVTAAQAGHSGRDLGFLHDSSKEKAVKDRPSATFLWRV